MRSSQRCSSCMTGPSSCPNMWTCWHEKRSNNPSNIWCSSSKSDVGALKDVDVLTVGNNACTRPRKRQMYQPFWLSPYSYHALSMQRKAGRWLHMIFPELSCRPTLMRWSKSSSRAHWLLSSLEWIQRSTRSSLPSRMESGDVCAIGQGTLWYTTGSPIILVGPNWILDPARLCTQSI